MKFELQFALRYLKSKDKKRFISVITLLSVAGVALGVATMLIVLSVLNGFENDLKEKILGFNAHITVSEYLDRGIPNYYSVANRIKEISSNIIGVSPFISIQAMLQSKYGMSGVVLRGIDPEFEPDVSQISQNLIKGNFKFDINNGKYNLVIGSELSKQLNVSLYDTVFIISKVINTGAGMIPKTKKCIISGIFKTGMYQYDLSFAFMDIKSTQKLYNLQDVVTGINVSVDKIFQAEKISKKITKELGAPYYARSWKNLNKNLFSAMKLEKVVMSLIIIIIIFVAGFSIIIGLVMLVMEKRVDIAVLKSLGATKRHISRIFMLQGTIIGIVGTVLGLMLGLILAYLLSKYQFIELPKDVYYINTIPVMIDFRDVIFIILGSIFICFSATIYPAVRAISHDPLEVFRYE